MKSGCYILYDEERNLFKIGCSKSILNRIKTVMKTCKFCGMKTKLQVFNIIYVKNYRLLEKHLHLLASKYNYQNEWFKCGQDQMNEVLFKIGSLDYYNK
jgi:hypothetical protein